MGCLSCSVLNTTLPLMPRFARESLLICISSSSWLTQRIMKMKSWQHVCLSSFWSVLSSCTKGFSEIRSNRFSFLFFCRLTSGLSWPRLVVWGTHVYLLTCGIAHMLQTDRRLYWKTGNTARLVFSAFGPRCLYVKAFSLTNIQTLNKLLMRRGIFVKGFAWENSVKSSSIFQRQFELFKVSDV